MSDERVCLAHSMSSDTATHRAVVLGIVIGLACAENGKKPLLCEECERMFQAAREQATTHMAWLGTDRASRS